MPRFDSYVICTSPRSGSTLLCSLLSATGVTGNPASWFHTASVADWLEQFDLTLDQSASDQQNLERAFNAAKSAGRSKTGMFGLRLQRHSFDFFTQQLSILQPNFTGDLQRLNAAFGRTAFIHLTRRDKVSQAVSFVKAEQTGLWHRSADGSELERLSPAQPAEYNAELIAASVAQMESWDREWQDWFAKQPIDPLRINYKALATDPHGTLCTILEFLDVEIKYAKGVVPGVAKLGDDVNRQWVERFRRE